eukprot:6460628-Prymnesium_polylepis.2
MLLCASEPASTSTSRSLSTERSCVTNHGPAPTRSSGLHSTVADTSSQSSRPSVSGYTSRTVARSAAAFRDDSMRDEPLTSFIERPGASTPVYRGGGEGGGC